MTDSVRKLKLLELAEKCEKATGPDRALDEEIMFATQFLIVDNPPPFTVSIDTSMLLATANYRLQLSEWDDEKHLRSQGPWQAIFSRAGSREHGFDPALNTRCEHAANAALAICSAAIKVLAEHC